MSRSRVDGAIFSPSVSTRSPTQLRVDRDMPVVEPAIAVRQGDLPVGRGMAGYRRDGLAERNRGHLTSERETKRSSRCEGRTDSIYSKCCIDMTRYSLLVEYCREAEDEILYCAVNDL